jgi:hypothetical protein
LERDIDKWTIQLKEEIMHIIAYTSECQSIDDDIDSILSDIVKISKKNNEKTGLTGVLFLHNHTFLQIIEGAHDALESLMTRLQMDTRHKNIVRIIDEEIPGRSFGSWSMDSFNLSDNECIDLKELTTIVGVGKRGLKINNEALIKFYKTMLRSNSLKDS